MKDIISFSAALMREFEKQGLEKFVPMIAAFTFNYLGRDNIKRMMEEELKGN